MCIYKTKEIHLSATPSGSGNLLLGFCVCNSEGMPVKEIAASFKNGVFWVTNAAQIKPS